ncbi:MAG: glutaredoxin family protein [Candidatus Dormibacteria bacterium]
MSDPDQDLIVYSTRWCGDCVRSKRVLEGLGVTYREVLLEGNPPAVNLVRHLNQGMAKVPTMIFPDGTVLAEPSDPELRAAVARGHGLAPGSC